MSNSVAVGGVVFPSFSAAWRALARGSGVPENVARNRYTKGWDILRACTEGVVPQPTSLTQRLLEVGSDLPQGVVRHRMRNGESFEEAISRRPEKEVTLHGVRYPTLKAAWSCIQGEKPCYHTYRQRVNSGETLEQALMPREPAPRRDGRSGWEKQFQRYRSSARRRGLHWALTKAEVEHLCSQDCYYCGAKPSRAVRGAAGEALVNGIDRVDNSQGYERDNVVPCCTACNRGKNQMTEAQWLELCRRVAGRHPG